MINAELRSKGVGASEVASLLGMSPFADAFSVWARKLNLIEEPPPDIRRRRGKYFEEGLARWYSDDTGNPTEWSDETMQSLRRPWQVVTPDAFVLDAPHTEQTFGNRIGGVDCKMVGFNMREGWGDSGTDKVPDHYAIQCQWTTSTLSLPWWDIAACLGDELRIYRIHHDRKVEEVLLDVVDKFWRVNVLGRTQPPIGATDAATAYLKQRFPKHIEPLREATAEEWALMQDYKRLRDEWDALEAQYDPIENQIRLMIGENEGIQFGKSKITWKKDKDSFGPNYQEIAKYLLSVACPICAPLGNAQKSGWSVEDCSACNSTRRTIPADGLRKLAALEAEFEVITRHGPRKLRPTFK